MLFLGKTVPPLYFLVANSSLYKNSLSYYHEHKTVVTEDRSEQNTKPAVTLPWNLTAGLCLLPFVLMLHLMQFVLLLFMSF